MLDSYNIRPLIIKDLEYIWFILDWHVWLTKILVDNLDVCASSGNEIAISSS